MHPVLRALKASLRELADQNNPSSTLGRQLETVIDRAQAILEAEETPKNFDEFWKLYPRKDSKDPARKAWKKMEADQAWPEIKKNILRRLSTKQWELTPERRQYIPMATTYLNQRRWLDVIPGERTVNSEGYVV